MGTHNSLPLSFFMVITIVSAAAASQLPLPPTILCNSTGCTVENYQRIWVDRKPCKAAQAVYPTSEAELLQAVAFATRTRTKMKVVSKGSHSLPKLVCPAGEKGLLISTQFYNSLIRVNLSSLTVTADGGVNLRTLLDTIALYNLTLPHTPLWQGVSVAGMISTGAHGSSMWGKGSAPHDYVVGLRLIVPATEDEGYAKVVDLTEEDDDLDAARLSLGVLGVISQVTFQLEPMFKRSVELHIKGDERLEDDILEFAREHEFGGLNWYPASAKVLYKVDDRVGVNTQGEGAYKLAIVDKMEVEVIESLRNGMEAVEETQDIEGLCQSEDMLMNFRHRFGDGLVNDEATFLGYPVVGFNHKMQTSGGCDDEEMISIIVPTRIDFNLPNDHHRLEETTLGQLIHKEDTLLEKSSIALGDSNKLFTCNWNPLIKKSLLFFDTSISIPASKVREAILEIKKLRDVNLKAMCSLGNLGGIWIRFQTKSKAYLGESNNSIVFEMFYYRAKEPNTPRLQQDLFEEIEQILVNKFGGKPHWAKNRDATFEGMQTRTLAMDKFLDAMKRYDPLRLFSNEWTDALLGLDSSSTRHVQTFQDHCALEGLCICKQDSHCHPQKGYFCRPGHVYKDARVCRYEN